MRFVDSAYFPGVQSDAYFTNTENRILEKMLKLQAEKERGGDRQRQACCKGKITFYQFYGHLVNFINFLGFLFCFVIFS